LQLDLKNSVVAGNNGTDVTLFSNRSPTTATYNYIGSISGDWNASSNNLTSGSINLGSLQNNGGLVQTHKPLPGSVLINAGSNALLPTEDTYDLNKNGITNEPLPADATGLVRVVNGTVDIGAVEYTNAAPTDIALSKNTLFTLDANGATVGILSDTDVDGPSGQATYSILKVTNPTSVDVTSSNLFGISGSNLTAATPSTLTPGNYTLQVQVNDGGAPAGIFSKNLAVTVIGNTLTVTTAADDAVGASLAADLADDGGLSLREALNWAAAGMKIDFDLEAATAGQQGGTITLGSVLTVGTSNLTVDGDLDNNGTPDITLSGGNAVKVMQVNGSVTGLLLDGLTLSGGRASSSGGGMTNAGSSTTFKNGVISGNTALESYGGGLYNAGTLTLINSTVSGNSVTHTAMGANGQGAGATNAGTLTLINSTVSGNTASVHGGGLYNMTGTLKLINSTVSGNHAGGEGGGLIAGSGSVTLTNSTVTNNNGQTFPSSMTGGIFVGSGGILTLQNSVVAENSGTNIKLFNGPSASANYSYLGSVDGTWTTSSNNLTSGSINLGPLQNNGGLVQTHKPLVGSVLINAGSNALVPADTFDLDSDGNTTTERLPADATGNARVFGSAVDIGAVEVGNTAPVNTVPAAQTTLKNTALVFSSSNGNAITVADADSTTGLTVTLAVTAGSGSLSLGSSGGLTVTDSDGSDGTLAFSGSIANLNTALSGLTYTPTSDASGANYSALTVTSNDDVASAVSSTVSISVAAGQFVLGDGSGGGGGGGSYAESGGNGGVGGGDADTLTGTVGNDVIFGDGSGGGAGGGGSFGGGSGANGAGGGGNDSIAGGSGNDVIFGDGFAGTNGKGGLGGGGGGGGGGSLFGGQGGQGGLGGGSGSGYDSSPAPLVSGFGGQGGRILGGNSATSMASATGLGGNGRGRGGDGLNGGGAFGGAAGGNGGNYPYNGAVGTSGNTTEQRYNDTTGSIHDYFTGVVLRGVLTTYPNFGAGADTLDGGGGSDELFGLGGNDTFIADLSAAGSADSDRIWDFAAGDKLQLKNESGAAYDNTSLQALLTAATLVDADGDGNSDDLRLSLSTTGKAVNVDLINQGTNGLRISGSDLLRNNAPSGTGLSGSITVTEDVASNVDLSALTLADTDDDSLTLTLAVNSGTLAATGTVSVTVGGSGTASLTLSGLAANINAYLDTASSVQYTTALNDNTARSLTATVTDGVVTAPVALGSSTLNITPVNDAPTLSGVPGTAQAVTVGQAAALADFTVADVDTASLTVTLTPANGVINGLTDANPGTPGIQLAGTATAINTAIAAATFTASAAGSASIALSLSDNVAAPVEVSYSLTASATPAPTPTPTPTPDPTPTPPSDTDTDGVPDSTENTIPGQPPAGGGTPVAGDGNGDSTPDGQQAGVASLPILQTPTPISNPGSAATVYVSLVADSKNGKIDADAGSVTLTNVRQLDAPANLPPGVNMPLGQISFDAVVGLSATPGVGVTETFSLYVDASLGMNAYFKKNAAGTWVNLASPEFGGQVVTEGGRTRLDFALTDGGPFDSDGVINGTIADPGAPGFSSNTAPSIAGLPATAQTVTVGSAAALADFTVADAEQGTTGLSVTLTASNGIINGLTDADASTAGIQLVGTAAAINTAIAGATFTASAAGAASITISASDGVITTPVTASYSLSASNANAAPSAVTLGNTTTRLPENTATTSRIKMADIIVTDDALGSNRITLTGADAARFEVDGTALYLQMT